MTPAVAERSAAAAAWTPEQRAAIADRGRAALLAAGAGSGKTAVMVERFAEAVLHDGVPVGSILTLTFTEKGAAELRERIRRRFVELGEPEHARAVDAGWIGTIHGFCARVLRSQPLAAGLDPRFTVLDEAAARRLATGAFETALEEWTAACGAPAIDLAAAYGRELEPMVTRAHGVLRSRGATHPRLLIPPAAPDPDPAELAAAAGRAAVALRAAPANGARVEAALGALEACERILAAGGGPPLPGALDDARLPSGARALEHDDCSAYRSAWEQYRAACADHHARPALALIDRLLDRFGAAYAAAKDARAGVDFEDLELRVRDLLAGDAGLRARWAERFELIMVDEFQDTNRLQLDVLEALERGNLFAVGDESQSIYGFRHADVGIFRARRAALGSEAVRGLTVNFRSRPEILDVVNAAFGPLLGEGFTPLVAGRAPDELRLFAPDPPEEPRVEVLVCETGGWEEREAELGLAGLANQTWRRAEARAVAARLRAEVDDAGRALRDLVVLVRATSSLRLYEQALEEQGLPTYVVGGRGYWSQEQVRDGLAYLALLANPHDEAALYAVLASPFCGATTDALVLLAEAGRESGDGAWAALRRAARDSDSHRPVSADDPDAVAPGGDPGRPVLGGDPGRPAVGGDPGRPAVGGDPGRPAVGGDPGRLAVGGDPGRPAVGGDPGRPVSGGDRRDAAGGPSWLAALPAEEAGRLTAFARFVAGERLRAERLPVEVLLERAIAATGYDLAILARAGGERRLANLRKLMRLAREYERAEGRDLRGFLGYAAGQDLAEAREGEAALESEGLDAVRLMTIHRAKGLEFPVVCVADLGRPGVTARERLLIAPDGTAGLKLATLAGGDPVPALGYDRIADELGAAEAAEERRLLYVAATRAQERLILSAGADPARRLEPRNGGPPIAWLGPALLGDPAAVLAEEPAVVAVGHGGVAATLITAANLPASAAAPTARERSGGAGTALPAEPKVIPSPGRPQPAQRRLSYSSLQDYARCGYRFYLSRVLGLPRVAPPPDDEGTDPRAAAEAAAVEPAAAEPAAAEPAAAEPAAAEPAAAEPAAAEAAAVPALDPRVRGTLVHQLLERLDFARPEPPEAEAVRALAAAYGLELTPDQVADVRALVAAFAASPLCARLAAAGGVRREAGFAYELSPGGGGPLVTGFVDVLARERDGRFLVIDYKTDRLTEGDTPAALVERDYGTQRMVYALAALHDGAERVEVAYCVLEHPDEPVAATFHATDAAALAETLLDLSAGVLAERWPVAARPHRELCGDCPGRASMCSWPESMTLRPPADAYEDSAGSLAGSGGPA
jgi:ATP-dependent helicase/nuclease subunit A